MAKPILKIEALTHVYSQGTPFEKTALDGVDLSIDRGEIISIVGHTGSGKSTLIQHFNGLIKPTAGAVYFDGEDINASKESVKKARSKVGLVFQYPEYQLFEETVYKDIAFGPGNMGLDKDDIDVRVREAARFVGIPAEKLDVSPFDLSGGEKRRVAIAGVVAMLPDVLVLDEPLAGLDPGGCEDILNNIRGYHEETGAAIVMVTHSMEIAATTDRIVVIDHGRIALDGTPGDIFSRGDELRAMGLETPAVTKVVDRLRAMGLDLPAGIYTVRQAREAICALRDGRKGGEDRA